jgi:YD repeat-containing protein
LGRLSSVASADAPVRRFVYGEDGRLASSVFGAETTQFGYSPRGLPAQTLTPDGRTLRLEYETAGRSLVELQSLGRSGGKTLDTRFVYDPVGHLSSRTDGDGTTDAATTSFVYGPRGEVRTVSLPTGATWKYDYDGLLRLKTLTPPTGAVQPPQAWQYDDALGRVTLHSMGRSEWRTSYSGALASTFTPRRVLRSALVEGAPIRLVDGARIEHERVRPHSMRALEFGLGLGPGLG